MEKIPFYFSIDFEDFTHDLGRSIGNPKPESREKALELSYLRAQYFSEKFFNGKKMTFFVTGVLARKSPELIKKIFNDGHEIGCHYNFHDNINLTTREDFANNLDTAIESINDIIGEKPLGFRAPNFAIDEENTWAYEELAKRFVYDSSFKTSIHINEILNDGQFNFNGNKLYEFCIFGLPILQGNFAVRTGGTFLRLFPVRLTIEAMKKTKELGHTPLIYMHPYEMTLNSDFWVPWKDLKYLKLSKRVIKWARQLQWSKLGHRGVEKKLQDICEIFEHQGPMKLLIDN
jgi:peptidoglycan/xylan/chitin deacetylase (PgdA/CDA1 family)